MGKKKNNRNRSNRVTKVTDSFGVKENKERQQIKENISLEEERKEKRVFKAERTVGVKSDRGRYASNEKELLFKGVCLGVILTVFLVSGIWYYYSIHWFSVRETKQEINVPSVSTEGDGYTENYGSNIKYGSPLAGELEEIEEVKESMYVEQETLVEESGAPLNAEESTE